jgi:hypothetical protein
MANASSALLRQSSRVTGALNWTVRTDGFILAKEMSLNE